MTAFSPAFSPTGFFAGPAADPTTGLSRIIAEAVGTYLEARLDRVSVEAIEVAEATKLTRIAAEVLQEFPATFVPLTRAVVEVIQQDAFAPPNITAEVRRVVAEVIGYAAEHLGKYTVLTRQALEVIATAALRHRGFSLPDVAVNAVTIAYSIDLELTKPGFWGLQGANGDGYSLTWASASPSDITETWRNGSTVVTSTFPAPTGRLVRVFTSPTLDSGVEFVDLASLRPDDRAGSGVLQELMVWNLPLTGPETTYLTTYLNGKWGVSGSPVPWPVCLAPPEPGEHFYECVAGDFNGLYIGYVDPIISTGPAVGTVSPDDGTLIGAITNVDGNVVQVIMALSTEEALTEATIRVEGQAPVSVAGTIAPGSDYGLPYPFLFVSGVFSSLPGMVVGAAFSVDVH